MKNMKKLVAIFAAATMAMSLSVSAFAEVIAPTVAKDSADAITGITFVDADGADISISNETQITMMAYLIPETDSEGTAYTAETIPDFDSTAHTIVALDQVGGSAGFGEVPVDVTKLVEGKAIAVKLGGSGGTVDQGLIVYNETVDAIVVTFMNGADTFATANAVDGKVTLPATNPELAAVEGYATTAYTFVEWVTEDGTAFTADTPVEANTTVYPKFKSNFTTGDITGDGEVKAADRGRINNYIKNNTNTDTVGVQISHLLDATVVTGDITGDGEVKAADRGRINNYIKNGTNTDTVGIAIYVVNK